MEKYGFNTNAGHFGALTHLLRTPMCMGIELQITGTLNVVIKLSDAYNPAYDLI